MICHMKKKFITFSKLINGSSYDCIINDRHFSFQNYPSFNPTRYRDADVYIKNVIKGTTERNPLSAPTTSFK